MLLLMAIDRFTSKRDTVEEQVLNSKSQKELQWNSDITLPGYNAFPPFTLVFLGRNERICKEKSKTRNCLLYTSPSPRD